MILSILIIWLLTKIPFYLHLKVASPSKNFKHKISKKSNNINFSLPSYTFSYNECESSQGGTGCSTSNNLYFKIQSVLQVNESESLESSFIDSFFPSKGNILCVCL